MSVAEDLTVRLTQAFQPDRLEITNDSAKHARHGGDDGSGESHFCVLIRAAVFPADEPGGAAPGGACGVGRSEHADSRAGIGHRVVCLAGERGFHTPSPATAGRSSRKSSTGGFLFAHHPRGIFELR